MNRPARRRPLRCTWGYAVFLFGLLLNTVFADDPVCLDKSEEKGGPAIVVFSPDGKWIAAMMHAEIIVWDFATKEKVATRRYEIVKPYDHGFAAVAFSPDSQVIVHVDNLGRVGLWDGSPGWADAPDREILGPLIGLDGQPVSAAVCPFGIAISPDGTRFVVARGRGTIKIAELDTGKDVGELEVGRSIDSVQISDRGKVLVVGTPGSSRDNPLVQFWNMETFTAEEPLHVRNPPRTKLACINDAVLSPTEDMLGVVVGNLNSITEVRLYELPSGRWSTLMKYDRRVICHPCFSPDGRLLAVPTEHGPGDPAAVLMWDLSAKTWRRFDCPSRIAQQNIAFMNAKFSPDGRYLAGGLWHPQVAVCIWDLQEDADKSESSGASR